MVEFANNRDSDVELTKLGKELTFRANHYDPFVAEIAKALKVSSSDPFSFIRRLVTNGDAQGYTPVELAILLEKLTIKHVVGNLWQEGIFDSPLFDRHLSDIRGRLSIIDWNSEVSDIAYAEAIEIVGKKEVQTNLIDRYSGITKIVLAPLMGANKGLVVAEAGASGALNTQTAIDAGLNVSKWLAVDMLKPDYPWILTCSIRLGELLDGRYKRYLDVVKNPPKSLNFVQGDICQLPVLDDTVDLYLAVFSWYQLTEHNRSLMEAKRIINEGGLIVVTDNIDFSSEGIAFNHLWENGELSTVVWTKKNGRLLGPYKIATWTNPLCREVKAPPEFEELGHGLASR